jgi:NifU-like protein involved in Fe-S cluster formation
MQKTTLKYYRKPVGKVKQQVSKPNPSCGETIVVYLIGDNVLAYSGDVCAVTNASASIMCEAGLAKEGIMQVIDYIQARSENLPAVLAGNKLLTEVRESVNKRKCLLLPWVAALECMEEVP